jgi:hypothetical protein
MTQDEYDALILEVAKIIDPAAFVDSPAHPAKDGWGESHARSTALSKARQIYQLISAART